MSGGIFVEIINFRLKAMELRSLLDLFGAMNHTHGLGDYKEKSFINEKNIAKLMNAEDFEVIFEKTDASVGAITHKYSVIHLLDGRQFGKSEMSASSFAIMISHLFGNNTHTPDGISHQANEILKSMEKQTTLHIIFQNMDENYRIKVLIY